MDLIEVMVEPRGIEPLTSTMPLYLRILLVFIFNMLEDDFQGHVLDV